MEHLAWLANVGGPYNGSRAVCVDRLEVVSSQTVVALNRLFFLNVNHFLTHAGPPNHARMSRNIDVVVHTSDELPTWLGLLRQQLHAAVGPPSIYRIALVVCDMFGYQADRLRIDLCEELAKYRY